MFNLLFFISRGVASSHRVAGHGRCSPLFGCMSFPNFIVVLFVYSMELDLFETMHTMWRTHFPYVWGWFVDITNYVQDVTAVYHAITKHIQVRYHYIRIVLEDGMLVHKKILGNQNSVDMLTKTIAVEKVKMYATSVGLYHK